MRSCSDIEQLRADSGRPAPRIAAGLLALLVFGGCSDLASVATFEPIIDPAQLFMAVTLDHRAVNLSTAAPYDTLRLTAVPRNALGDPASGLPAATFRSTDTTRVWVSADGLIRALRAATGVRVIAEVTADGNIRHADTAFVNVTANPTPPELVTFSITPVAPEDATWSVIPDHSTLRLSELILGAAGIRVRPSLLMQALDATGNPIPGLAIDYRSLDPLIISVNQGTGYLTPTAPGQTAIVARTMAYGVAMADTAVVTIGMPLVQEVRLIPGSAGGPLVFGATEVTIQRGGYVFWTNFAEKTPMAIVFEDPTSVAEIPEVCAVWGPAFCGGGDIPAFDGGTFFTATRGRRFPVPGVYTYRSTLTGHSGRVIVTDGTTP